VNLNDAETLARHLMRQHNVEDWSFRFDNAKRRFGVCQYRYRRIQLSAPLTLLNSEEQVRDTILHEIAHILAGPQAKHGPAWKRVAASIGASPTRCADVGARPPAKWRGACPNCDFVVERHRLTERSATGACPKCCAKYAGGRFSERFALSWTENTNTAVLVG